MGVCASPKKESEKLKVDCGPTTHLLAAKWWITMLPRVTLLTNREERQRQNREDILQLLVSEKLLPKSNEDKRKPMKHLPIRTCIF